MDVTDIARWQFGIITVYHFLFVPITIGLSAIVASFETLWLVKRREDYLRLTKFFGKLFLINFAIGVVTGIVQEFQFGMNWSAYSRFVGDIFGAPLAAEGLLAFFVESTFLGLWIFGWDKLPRAVHAATIWLVHIGTLVSAWFILAANSWMQHPVGYSYNPRTHRAELHDFWAVMFNKVQLITFPHVVTAAYMTGGAFVLGICAFLYFRYHHDRELYRRGMRIGAVWCLVAGLGVAITGDTQGKIMTDVQPMKMAAAEALYNTEDNATFSVLSIGTLDGTHANTIIHIPGLLSFLAEGRFGARVEGIRDIEKRYQQQYGDATGPASELVRADRYTPVIPMTYWSFRFMIGLGLATAALAILILVGTRRKRTKPAPKWLPWAGMLVPTVAVLGSSWGWIFTEMGRQPWSVFGVMTTQTSSSPGISTTEAWISLLSLTLLYAVLMVIELGLTWKVIKHGAAPFEEPPDPGNQSSEEDAPMAFAY